MNRLEIMDFYSEINRLPVREAYDVAVIGAGVGGVAAALAAARSGMKTLLVEKGVLPGGLATSGLIVHYLPLCDGCGRKIIGGIAEELLQLSIRYGGGTLPEAWRSGTAAPGTTERYRTCFNPGAFVLALDEVLAAAGVDVLYDTAFGGVEAQDGWVSGVIVDNLTGRCLIPVRAAVDATGSAELFFKAGAPVVVGQSELSYWALAVDEESVRAGNDARDLARAIKVSRNGFVVDMPENRRLGEESAAPQPVYEIKELADMTRFVLDGRRLLQKYRARMQTGQMALACLPSVAQHRTTRRIDGVGTMTIEAQRARAEHSVGCVSDWRKAGPVYEVPLEALYTRKLKNVLAAGRCMAAAGEAWEIMRCIPQAAATGEAAGQAAALCVKRHCAVGSAIYGELAQNLAAAKIMLHTGK